MQLFANDSATGSFWKWFISNEKDLYDFESNQEAVFDRLTKEMHKVHEDLTFEFSPVRENGTREFVISAGGIKEAFPAVESLHDSAPKLARWNVLKYRQRRSPLNDLDFGGRRTKAKEVHYLIFKDDDPEKVGIMLFLDGYINDEQDLTWKQIGYLFLDEALGEYDVEMHVGAIVFFDRESEYYEHASPLAELADHFDRKLGRSVE